jgi:hypothetical protein
MPPENIVRRPRIFPQTLGCRPINSLHTGLPVPRRRLGDFPKSAASTRNQRGREGGGRREWSSQEETVRGGSWTGRGRRRLRRRSTAPPSNLEDEAVRGSAAVAGTPRSRGCCARETPPWKPQTAPREPELLKARRSPPHRPQPAPLCFPCSRPFHAALLHRRVATASLDLW